LMIINVFNVACAATAMPRDKVVSEHTEERGIFKTTVREYATGEKEIEIADKVTGARFTLTPEEYEEFARRFEQARRQALATGKKLKPQDIDEMLKEVTREREKWGSFEQRERETREQLNARPEEMPAAAEEKGAPSERLIARPEEVIWRVRPRVYVPPIERLIAKPEKVEIEIAEKRRFPSLRRLFSRRERVPAGVAEREAVERRERLIMRGGERPPPPPREWVVVKPEEIPGELVARPVPREKVIVQPEVAPVARPVPREKVLVKPEEVPPLLKEEEKAHPPPSERLAVRPEEVPTAVEERGVPTEKLVARPEELEITIEKGRRFPLLRFPRREKKAPMETLVEFKGRPPQPYVASERKSYTVETPYGRQKVVEETYKVGTRPGMQYTFKTLPTGEKVVEIKDLATGRSITVPEYAYEAAVKKKMEELSRQGLKPDQALAKASPDILRLAALEFLTPKELKQLEKAWRLPLHPIAAAEQAKREVGSVPSRVTSALKRGFKSLLWAGMPPKAALNALTMVIAYSAAAVAVGLLGGYIEGKLAAMAPPYLGWLFQVFAWALSGLYSILYLCSLMATHVLVASALLVTTRMIRSGAEWAEYAKKTKIPRTVDLFAWTVMSAVLAITVKGIWVPLILGFVADALFSVVVAFTPLFTLVLMLALAIFFLIYLLAGVASRMGNAGELFTNLVLFVLVAPILPFIGMVIQLWALARLVEKAWEATDAALALMLALMSLLAWLAPPLIAAVMATIWVIFGLIASGSKDWRWFRIPLAVTATYAVSQAGWDRDWAASTAIELFKAIGQQLGAQGMVRTADFYAWLLSMLNVKL